MSEEIFDVAVIGGAMSGSRTAELIAEKGHSVLLIEEHPQIGVPCKCTGLVSWRFHEVLPDFPKKLVVNTVNNAKFFAPNGKMLQLKSKNPVSVISRPGLDKFLFDHAKKAGAVAKTTERFLNFNYVNNGVEIKTDKSNYKAKLLIGADGANSAVAKSARIQMPEKYLVGVQTTAEGNYDVDAVELWFGSEFSPKFFAWVVPENENIARIGLASKPSPMQYYKKFLEKRIGNFIKPDVGGVIRGGLIKTSVANRVMLVGDAACQIKPYSGGGITYGLIASQFCADAAVVALDNYNFTKEFLKKNYDSVWKNKLAMPIKRGSLLHKTISSPDLILNFLFTAAKAGKSLLNNLDMDLIDVFV